MLHLPSNRFNIFQNAPKKMENFSQNIFEWYCEKDSFVSFVRIFLKQIDRVHAIDLVQISSKFEPSSRFFCHLKIFKKIPNENSGRAFGTFGRPADLDCLSAVFDRLGAVFDRFAVVFDRFGAVFDRLGAVIDRKTAPKRSIWIRLELPGGPPKGPGSSSRIQMLKSSLL